MKLGGEYKINNIGIENFEAMAKEAGISTPGARKRLMTLAEQTLTTADKIPILNEVQQDIRELIKSRCKYLTVCAKYTHTPYRSRKSQITPP